MFSQVVFLKCYLIEHIFLSRKLSIIVFLDVISSTLFIER